MASLKITSKFFDTCGHTMLVRTRKEFWNKLCPACAHYAIWAAATGWSNAGMPEQTAAIKALMISGQPDKPGTWRRADTAARALLVADKEALALWHLAGGTLTPVWVRDALENRKVVKEQSTHAKAGTQCKAAIKAGYPAVTIVSAKTNTFSGGTSLHVVVSGVGEDDTRTRRALYELVDGFSYGHFNGMDDSFEYRSDTVADRSYVKYSSITFSNR